MKEQKSKMILPKLDDLFTTQEQRDYENAEKVVFIDINIVYRHNRSIFEKVNFLYSGE